MKIIYMGTNGFAVAPLKAIYESYGKDNEIIVFTQPDKPKGRSMKMAMSEVKEYALSVNLPIFQPETLKSEFFEEEFLSLGPDLIVVASYGKILPEYILNYPKFGCVNIHASVLPEYRGAAPINRVIMDGKNETGISIMYMEKGLDTGDILKIEKTDIGEDESFGELYSRLSDMGARMIIDIIPDLIQGKVTAVKQDDSLSCYAQKIEKEDLIIDWSRSAHEIRNQIRGLCPIPCAKTHIERLDKSLKIKRASIGGKRANYAPGTVVSLDRKIEVACGEGTILIEELQLEGQKSMNYKDFLNGRKLTVGDIFN